MASTKKSLTIFCTDFGRAPDGTPVNLYTVTNVNGMVVKVTDYGGIITEIHVPDKDGNFADVCLGFDNIQAYYKNPSYFGALIGRFANRIARGSFELDGKRYYLSRNDGNNHLHGGTLGYDQVVWKSSTFTDSNTVGITFKHVSPDGDQGYPGNLQLRVDYEFTDDNEIIVKFYALTDTATPINLTQHTYFNLAGEGDILSHKLELNADSYLPINHEQIPLGELQLVENSPFDFSSPCAIGARIEEEHLQLENGRGYDHNFVLNSATDQPTFAARVYEPTSGRQLELFTTAPGIQFYSGNFLDGSQAGKGRIYTHRSGFCLEPQHFPDSPNHPQFPNAVLRPDESYTSTIIYKFSVKS